MEVNQLIVPSPGYLTLQVRQVRPSDRARGQVYEFTIITPFFTVLRSPTRHPLDYLKDFGCCALR